MKTITILENIKIYIGENMYDNHKLYNIVPNNTVFFHLKDFSSSHLYLQCDQKINEIDFELLDKCCNLVKKHSCRNKNKSAMIMYCEKSNIKQSKNIGEVEILNDKKVYYYVVEL